MYKLATYKLNKCEVKKECFKTISGLIKYKEKVNNKCNYHRLKLSLNETEVL